MDFQMELKRIVDSYTFAPAEEERLITSVEKILLLSRIARAEGLLSLEVFVNSGDARISDYQSMFEKYSVNCIFDEYDKAYLFDLIELLTLGTDSWIIRQIGEATLCSSSFSQIGFIQYVIYLEGILHIQAGLQQNLLGKLLTAYLPVNSRKKYMDKRNPGITHDAITAKALLSDNMARICTADAPAIEENSMHRVLMLLSDRDMQCLNNCISIEDLAIALMSMPMALRKKFLDNLFYSQCKWVVDSVLAAEPISTEEAENALTRIFKVLQKLEDSAAIHIETAEINTLQGE